MLTIKDFEIGDTAYVVTRSIREDTKFFIEKVTVVSVGRIYVTVDNGTWKPRFINADSEYLLQKVDWGEPDLLFKTKEDFKDYVEKCDLAQWLGRMSVCAAEKYSVEQLRKVREILKATE